MRTGLIIIGCLASLATIAPPAMAANSFGVSVVIQEPSQASYKIPAGQFNVTVPQKSNHNFSITGAANAFVSIGYTYTLDVDSNGIAVGGLDPEVDQLDGMGNYSSSTTILSGSATRIAKPDYHTNASTEVHDNNDASAHNSVSASNTWAVTF